MTRDGGSALRRRCRMCGSRRIVLEMAGASRALPPDIPPVAGGAEEPPEGRLRWRCRRCGTTMHYHGEPEPAWRRRKPLSNWLFRG